MHCNADRSPYLIGDAAWLICDKSCCSTQVAALLHQVEQTLAQDAIKRSSQPTSTSSPDAHPHLHASDTTPPTRSPTDPLIPPSCIPPAMRAGHMLQPSADGIDYNLLILLHGLGDKPGPFARLAQQLALPQTASMALPGPLVVPETGGGRAWLTAFDDEWELIQVSWGPAGDIGLGWHRCWHQLLALLLCACLCLCVCVLVWCLPA